MDLYVNCILLQQLPPLKDGGNPRLELLDLDTKEKITISLEGVALRDEDINLTPRRLVFDAVVMRTFVNKDGVRSTWLTAKGIHADGAPAAAAAAPRKGQNAT